MIITKEHLIGFAAGVGASALGYYMYKKNEQKVDCFLKNHKINLGEVNEAKYDSMSLEELVLQKENIEDLIAEKEMITKGQPVTTSCEVAEQDCDEIELETV